MITFIHTKKVHESTVQINDIPQREQIHAISTQIKKQHCQHPETLPKFTANFYLP